MDSCNRYKSDQWPLLLIMQVCVTACMFIVSSNRHRKQLQHRTECPEGEKGVIQLLTRCYHWRVCYHRFLFIQKMPICMKCDNAGSDDQSIKLYKYRIIMHKTKL